MAKKEQTAEELAALQERRQEEQRRESAKREREKSAMGGLWSRRDFFGRLGWVGFGVFSGVTLLAAVRSAFPRILFRPPATFKAGKPTDFSVGEVSEKFKKEFRVWIVREAGGLYALFAKCTHLGCTPRWLSVEEKFKCPCHGSGFRKSGINFEGPAPRPLERYRVSLNDNGELVIDRSVKYLYEKGEWTKPGAFLKV